MPKKATATKEKTERATGFARLRSEAKAYAQYQTSDGDRESDGFAVGDLRVETGKFSAVNPAVVCTKCGQPVQRHARLSKGGVAKGKICPTDFVVDGEDRPIPSWEFTERFLLCDEKGKELKAATE